MKTKRIGEVLVEEGIISPEQLQKALESQKQTSRSLGETLVELGFLTEDALYHFLAIQHGMEFIDSEKVTVSPEMQKICPEAVARKLMVFPLEMKNKVLRLATSNPENPALLHLDSDLVIPAGTEFEIVLTKQSDLLKLIDRIFKPNAPVGKDLNETLHDLETAEGGDIEVVEIKKIGESETDEEGFSLGDEGPVMKICNYILDQAAASGASDIHINCYEKRMVLRYRIDGTLVEFPSPSFRYKRAVSSRFKIMARLDPMERRKPQDGRIKYKFRGRSIDLRLSILPAIWGENIVMRIIDQGSRKLDIKDMNFTADQLKAFEDAYMQPYGMILVCGPTGSGKTTTLYSVLTALNDPCWNIMTAEDPVEYRLPHIVQCQVNMGAGLTFAGILRSFLRQDPDIIMVGEIRDKETADTAIKASLTGHLVISTLHTNDAPATIMRLVDTGVDPMYVGTAVLVVCAQKLLRRVCSNCKQPYTPTPEEIEALGLAPEKIAGGSYAKGTGCDQCHKTGYKGRLAVHEVMKVNPVIRKAIFDKMNLKDLKATARANGMATMREVAFEECRKGITTIEEIIAETAPDK
jgi:type IV pilus assembly protein PilB